MSRARRPPAARIAPALPTVFYRLIESIAILSAASAAS